MLGGVNSTPLVLWALWAYWVLRRCSICTMFGSPLIVGTSRAAGGGAEGAAGLGDEGAAGSGDAGGSQEAVKSAAAGKASVADRACSTRTQRPGRK